MSPLRLTTFQPGAGSLPEFERQLYRRVASDFQGWLSSHGYLGNSQGDTVHWDEPETVSGVESDQALSAYLGALMRESASKEAEIRAAADAVAAAQAALRDKEAALLAVTKSLEEKDGLKQRHIGDQINQCGSEYRPFHKEELQKT